MRTYYPYNNGIEYYTRIVNSSFIHAILLKSNLLGDHIIGVAFLKDEDKVHWYKINDGKTIYNKLTDPTKSVGFIFNNSLRGKPSTMEDFSKYPKQKPEIQLKSFWTSPEHKEKVKKLAEEVLSDQLNSQENILKVQELPKKTAVEAYWNKLAQDIVKQNVKKPLTPTEKALEDISKIVTQLVKDVEPRTISNTDKSNVYGPVLHVNTKDSSCIFYLSLGFDTKTLENTIFYSLSSAPNDVYVIKDAQLSLYKEWIKSESLGKFYNQRIKHFTHSVLLRSLAKA